MKNDFIEQKELVWVFWYIHLDIIMNVLSAKDFVKKQQ